MLEKITIERQKEIEKEVFGDTKKYLENCLDNYSEYVSVAQKLFPEAYNKIRYLTRWVKLDYLNFNIIYWSVKDKFIDKLD